MFRFQCEANFLPVLKTNDACAPRVYLLVHASAIFFRSMFTRSSLFFRRV